MEKESFLLNTGSESLISSSETTRTQDISVPTIYKKVEGGDVEGKKRIITPEDNTVNQQILDILDKDKVDRYLKLSNKVSGPDEYLELFGLQQEIARVTFNVTYRDANKVPESIDIDPTIEVFTPEDVLVWKDGATRFSEFNKKVLTNDSLRSVYLKTITPDPYSINEFKALFLKVKPVFLSNEETDISMNKDVIDLLEQNGISVIGNCYYDKVQVIEIIKDNPDIFNMFGTEDSDEIMKIIFGNNEDINFIARGLLLGYPKDSVKEFAAEMVSGEERGIKRKKTQVYGISWMDYGDSVESKIKQVRLKEAFELSGILKV